MYNELMSKKVKDITKALDLSVRLVAILKIGGTIMVGSMILMFIALWSGFPQPETLYFFGGTFIGGALLSLIAMIIEAILKHYKGKRKHIEEMEDKKKTFEEDIEEIEIKRFGGK